MPRERVEDQWPTLKVAMRRQWEKLTDDDMDEVEARRAAEQRRMVLCQRLQERYGIARTEAEEQVRSLMQRH